MEKTKTQQKEKSAKYAMTITKELFNAWQQLRRKNDAEELSSLLGKSRPIIDRALNYGHVKSNELVEGITKYYEDRKTKEKQRAKLLTTT